MLAFAVGPVSFWRWMTTVSLRKDFLFMQGDVFLRMMDGHWCLRADYISLLAGVLHTPICVCFGVSPLRRDGDPSVYLVEFELQTVVDL